MTTPPELPRTTSSTTTRALAFLGLVVALLVGPLVVTAAADEYRTFYVDPQRSSLSFESGDAGFQLSSDAFTYSALSLQPGSGVDVPLSGSFVAVATGDFTSATFVSIVPGTSDFMVANDQTASPGLAGVSGSAPAAFGVSFMDGSFLFDADAALRDLRMSASGFLEVIPNGLGSQGLRGDLNWQIASGVADVRTNLGLSGRAHLGGDLHAGSTALGGFVESQTSQLTEVSPGEYELLMPVGFTASLSGLRGPMSQLGMSGTFSGQIVATTIPEPGPGTATTTGLLTLYALRRARRRR